MREILSADIGGTNSRFAHFRADGPGRLELAGTLWLGTGESSSFGGLLERVRSKGFSLRPEDANITAVAVAGPVEKGNYSAPPFIDWDIDVSKAGEDFGLGQCILINDFVAQAYACLTTPGESAQQVLPGKAVPEAATAVMGAGTGLGKAAILPDGRGGFVPLPSEGGHADFPFVGGRECEYQGFLIKELGGEYPTGNAVVSGRGLCYLHRFLTGEDLSPEEVTATFTSETETLVWAARFYGRACRDFALETLARGGFYIAGGVAAKAPALVTHRAFREEFRSSPAHAALLAEIPVYLITDEQSGLWGAALMGLMELEKG
jgi:glucokinase